MKNLVMKWTTVDGRLACRWRELESKSAETVSSPHPWSDEAGPGAFVAIGGSGSNGEVSHAT